jgi:divalent metal cation (Fe/Co/Zn/Cd) transporter
MRAAFVHFAWAMLGVAMVVVGFAISSSWRRVAEKYTDLVDAMVPPMPWGRYKEAEDQFKRLLRQQRLIFAVIAMFGLLLVGSALLSSLPSS